jgi:predicted metal-binding membrane protein
MATKTRAPFLPKLSTISDRKASTSPTLTALFDRESLPAWIALGTASLLAWILILRHPGSGSIQKVSGITSYIAMWTLMTAAMMFPSLSSVVYLWLNFIRHRVSGKVRVLRIGLFLSGYVIAWTLTGFAAYFGSLLFERLIWLTRPFAVWLVIATFLVGGLYQLSPLKEACLRHCRTPFSLITEFSGRRGRAIDLRLGLYHGMLCIACCWGLMLILLAVGVMDLPAMIGLAAVTCIEKLTPFGLQAGRLVGWAFIVTAVVISIWPSLMPIPGAYLCRVQQ